MKDTLNNIKAELTEAYSLLSMIAVNGDNVDRLAEARARIRKAFHAAKDAAAGLEAKGPDTKSDGVEENKHG